MASAISSIDSDEVLEASSARPGDAGVEFGEDGLLHLEPLGDRLDDQIDVAERRVVERRFDAADDPLDLRVRLGRVEAATFDEPRELRRAHPACLVDRRVEQRAVYVLERDIHARGGDRLRDLAAHDPGAHDAGPSYVHAALSSRARWGRA